jgi:hypothetical protein
MWEREGKRRATELEGHPHLGNGRPSRSRGNAPNVVLSHSALPDWQLDVLPCSRFTGLGKPQDIDPALSVRGTHHRGAEGLEAQSIIPLAGMANSKKPR